MGSYWIYESPLGPLLAAENGRAITRLGMLGQFPAGFFAKEGLVCAQTSLLTETGRQLEEYFQRRRRTFTLPLEPKGTPFRQRVWQAQQSIPYGQTWTYGQVALAAGAPRAYRAVGTANRDCPISILIPCHRVVRADGLGSYGPDGQEIKKFLLELESGE